jgi:hypothetical protein
MFSELRAERRTDTDLRRSMASGQKVTGNPSSHRVLCAGCVPEANGSLADLAWANAEPSKRYSRSTFDIRVRALPSLAHSSHTGDSQ